MHKKSNNDAVEPTVGREEKPQFCLEIGAVLPLQVTLTKTALQLIKTLVEVCMYLYHVLSVLFNSQFYGILHVHIVLAPLIIPQCTCAYGTCVNEVCAFVNLLVCVCVCLCVHVFQRCLLHSSSYIATKVF